MLKNFKDVDWGEVLAPRHWAEIKDLTRMDQRSA